MRKQEDVFRMKNITARSVEFVSGQSFRTLTAARKYIDYCLEQGELVRMVELVEVGGSGKSYRVDVLRMV